MIFKLILLRALFLHLSGLSVSGIIVFLAPLRPEDLRIPFESFGPVNDVYLPRNYHTGKPAGFGFVKYRNAEDAAEAKHHMNNQIICGHQISVVFSKEDAKRPEQMLAKEHNT
ncbi:serine/arginine-rich SC35-like splicing factor SCL28 isoform X4 [Cryptomeria japonica]|uniref:serine/arginine-rich SC35-like splicing factor SCL28 isoform X4 n=1 Tax=Cryptomeria japonica TaxID=3369 RepID=UPI0025AC2998|nr:serine/arginine-rich SC35-like splicing factor SCL28 isoform X4 [Cryptomeria japonica]